MDRDCIFCKIVAGDLPCVSIYEDSDTLAFLDIGPVVKGHTLVIPKAHHDPIMETPADVLAKVIVTVRRVARAVVKGLAADGMNVTQANGAVAGQVVPHIHFHLIPRSESDGQTKNWLPGQYESNEEMAAFAERIRQAME